MAAASGSRLYGWDGTKVATYDPDRGEWTTLPKLPGEPAAPLAVVWADDRLLVWRVAPRAGRTPGAAWNPRDRRWTVLPPAPIAVNSATAVWGDDHVYLVGSWLGDGNDALTEQAVGAVYDAESNSWRRLPPTGLSPQASSAGWVGGRLLAWDYVLNAKTFDPGAGRWKDLPRLPLKFGECPPRTAVVGSRLAAWYCGQLALWDTESSTWIPVRVPGRGTNAVIGQPVAVGNSMIIVSVETINYPAATWRFDVASYEAS